MIKKALSISLIALSFVACNKRGSLESMNLPEWVFDPYSVSKTKDELAAVGIAEKSPLLGFREQLQKAELDGIGNLGSQIKTRVDKVVEDSVKQEISGTANSSGKDAVAQKAESVTKAFSSMTKSVVDGLDISGFQRKEIYQSPSDGTLYVRVIIDIKRVENHFKNNVRMYDELKKMGVKESDISRFINRTLGAGLSSENKPAPASPQIQAEES
jgi:hypothetical protein